MNYLKEINSLYDKLETNPLSAHAITLWHALMATANKAGWVSKFAVAISTLEAKTSLNKKAIERARNELAQKGYIGWNKRNGNLSAEYYINSLCDKKDVDFVPQSVAQDDPQSVAQPVAINKLNYTKKELKEKVSNFSPPDIDLVKAYCSERNNCVNPDRFFDFYQSKGWMIGKNKMKDWKAAVRTWEKEDKKNSDNGKTSEIYIIPD